MKSQIKTLIITTGIFFIVIFLVSSSLHRIQYLSDSFRSFVLDTAGPEDSADAVTIIDHALKKRYINPYTNAPADLYASGPFLFYRVPAETTAKQAAESVIGYTVYLKASRLGQDIAAVNGIVGQKIAAGRIILVPGALPHTIEDIQNIRKPALITTRGLYFSGGALGNGEILENLARFKKLGINCIVFDAKDIPGIVTYKSSIPAVVAHDTHRNRSIDNLARFIRLVKREGFYLIARIAVFRDHLLVQKDPSLAIHSARTGGVWNAGSKEIWCDPTNKKVQDYAIALAVELCALGVDEIQFDYIRFPTVGDLGDARYRYDFGQMSKKMAITHFLGRAQKEIASRNAMLSIDIFGVVAWGKEVDINKTGQEIGLLAEHCDVISPMLYPSHFNDDFDGFQKPGDNPYHFIYNGCVKVMDRSKNRAAVRPWLQAFKWRVSRYDSAYVIKQIQASRDAGARGYLFWNAKNNYDEVLRAMELMSVEQALNDRKH
ncbi:MAG TPA: putative glycoside hydrolase [Spirochaetota bacterium]|nr:putative glycoside hydrolase [Spirochaetota bacterium]HPI90736.1 putative glycoside hydrolase [Spirochaetota bacterium]HPR46360.1 putative glycoside hydrolase [Spirochaetota bacterium]